MTLVERFRESMEMNLERWRDGTGYDLEALAAATPGERAQIETLLLAFSATESGRGLVGRRAAWAGFALMAAGFVASMAMAVSIVFMETLAFLAFLAFLAISC